MHFLLQLVIKCTPVSGGNYEQIFYSLANGCNSGPVKRNSQIGKDLADAGEQTWLIQGNELQERFTIGVGRQKIDLGIDGKVA